MVDGRTDQTYNIGDTVYYIESYLDIYTAKIKESKIKSISSQFSIYRLANGQTFHFGDENKVFFKDKIEMLLTFIQTHTKELYRTTRFHTDCINKYNELLQEETRTNVKNNN